MAVSGECHLKDGRTVVLREAGPQDVLAIARLYMELSGESSRSRFHGGQPGPALVSRFARLDSAPGTVSVVAAMTDEPGRLAAEARYVSVGEGAAELALTVLDGYQDTGLGRLLLGALVERARGSGIERLRAVVSLANGPMLHLLEPYGWVLAEPTDSCSVAYLEISAVGGMPGWPAADAGPRVLVERRGWFDDARVAALRSAGNDVRVCNGPRRRTGRTCPLLTSGHCRLAEEADLIVFLLPCDDQDCAAVLEAHRRQNRTVNPGTKAGYVDASAGTHVASSRTSP
ncbi:MAG: N-acetyltransferase family protein [Micromonosporaceae bacterium]